MASAVQTCSLGAASPPTPPTTPPPALTQQQLSFLSHYSLVLGPKLERLLALLQEQEVAANLALAQVWTYVPVLLEGRQVLKAERACLLGVPSLAPFHAACAEQGVTASALGPMGKVWEAGHVMVVQDVGNLSPDGHPLARLGAGGLGLARHVGELVYMPVYERGSRVFSGVVAVLEVMMAAASHDYMVVANVISCISSLLESLGLSISNPAAPAPAPRPAPGGPPQPPVPAAGAQQHAAAPALRRPSSMARTSSMRHLGT
eukprot:scaffold22.g6059.t1